ncbi:hypothetical protein EUGRSUZ_F02210 [Eucalyptus grandis]|uniref:Uncharacterized protein n=2 Tax=Eucalyptus grandis TaxID=71139 RepID=A0ACC3KHR3_EUCGR|nr:hypothetical protein EUGRSUZ_F02210 [Eucalyptus grandis]
MNKYFASSFDSIYSNSNISHLLKDLFLHVLDMSLVNMFLLSRYNDGVRDAQFRHTPPNGKAVGMYSSLMIICNLMTRY